MRTKPTMYGFLMPNNFVDDYLPLISGNAVKAYLIIARFTKGWERDTCWLSISRISNVAKISRSTVIKVYRELKAFELIEHRLVPFKHGKIAEYRISRVSNKEPVQNLNPSKNGGEPIQKRRGTYVKTGTPVQKIDTSSSESSKEDSSSKGLIDDLTPAEGGRLTMYSLFDEAKTLPVKKDPQWLILWKRNFAYPASTLASLQERLQEHGEAIMTAAINRMPLHKDRIEHPLRYLDKILQDTSGLIPAKESAPSKPDEGWTPDENYCAEENNYPNTYIRLQCDYPTEAGLFEEFQNDYYSRAQAAGIAKPYDPHDKRVGILYDAVAEEWEPRMKASMASFHAQVSPEYAQHDRESGEKKRQQMIAADALRKENKL